ncbi:MAG: hypothetical protein JWM51_684 [Microbacteriaceae bacterium]|nr:hypothetical protein [Microbacteriaceae bacterium]
MLAALAGGPAATAPVAQASAVGGAEGFAGSLLGAVQEAAVASVSTRPTGGFAHAAAIDLAPRAVSLVGALDLIDAEAPDAASDSGLALVAAPPIPEPTESTLMPLLLPVTLVVAPTVSVQPASSEPVPPAPAPGGTPSHTESTLLPAAARVVTAAPTDQAAAVPMAADDLRVPHLPAAPEHAKVASRGVVTPDAATAVPAAPSAGPTDPTLAAFAAAPLAPTPAAPAPALAATRRAAVAPSEPAVGPSPDIAPASLSAAPRDLAADASTDLAAAVPLATTGDVRAPHLPPAPEHAKLASLALVSADAAINGTAASTPAAAPDLSTAASAQVAAALPLATGDVRVPHLPAAPERAKPASLAVASPTAAAAGPVDAAPTEPAAAAAPAAPGIAPASTAVPLLAAPSGPVAPAASAPTAPTPPAPLATQVATPIFTLAAAGTGEHTMTIDIAPENLGSLTVRAHVSPDGVRVELFASSDVAREAVRAILPEIRRDLGSAGLGSNLDLSSQNQPTDRDGAGAGNQSPSPQESGQRRALQTAQETTAVRWQLGDPAMTIDVMA